MSVPDRMPWIPQARRPDDEGVHPDVGADALLCALIRKAVARHGSRWPSELHRFAAVLDQEVDRLPMPVKAPFVYCDLGRYTIEEAAEMLGWSLRRVRRRLARGRRHLCRRLRWHGLAISARNLARWLRRDRRAAPGPEESLIRLAVVRATRRPEIPTRSRSRFASLLNWVLAVFACSRPRRGS